MNGTDERLDAILDELRAIRARLDGPQPSTDLVELREPVTPSPRPVRAGKRTE